MAPPRRISDDEILELIPELTARAHGVAPTVDEMAEAAGFAYPPAMHRRLVALRAAGLVTWQDGKPRTLRVVVPGEAEPEAAAAQA